MRSAVFNPALLFLVALTACGGANAPNDGAVSAPLSERICGASAVGSDGRSLPPPQLQVPKGFAIETIASIETARELAALPNGDLLVGTVSSDICIVPNAEGTPGAPHVFVTIPDSRAAGITFAPSLSEIFVGSHNHVWAIPYHGERKAPQIRRIADVRTGPIAPGSRRHQPAARTRPARSSRIRCASPRRGRTPTPHRSCRTRSCGRVRGSPAPLW